MNILDAIDDSKVFGPAFRDPASWTAWTAFLAALFGLPMDKDQRRIFRACTDRKDKPTKQSNEAWLVCGRRAGKSFTLALIACFLACFRDWKPFLGPGERGTIMVIAADRKQARVIIRYVKGLLQSVPMLKRLIQAERQEAVDLSNRVTIEVHTASFRTVRGYTILAALLDEVAFWQGEDSSNPDVEIINAIKPAMATVPDAILLCASSPYARRGALWEAYRKHFGKAGSILVWKAATRTMNPTVPERFVKDALEEDPASAGAEYLAEFRTDIEGFVSREAVEGVTDWATLERPPIPYQTYSAFVDPSGGSSDSMTLAIAHNEGTYNDETGVLDVVREVRPPFSPEAVVEEFAGLLETYNVASVQGDRYAGEWPRERFRKHGIDYEPNADPKSVLYQQFLPLINSGKVRLLGNKRLVSQLTGLERRTARGGRDSIDHQPGAHDDVANCAAGVLVNLEKGGYDVTLSWV